MLNESLARLFENVVVPVMGTAVSLLLSWILLKIKEGINIQTKKDTEQFLQMKAEEAVQFVAETVASQIKQNKDINFGGYEKLELAATKIMDSIPKISEEEAKEYIIAAVARIEGEGSTKKSILPKS